MSLVNQLALFIDVVQQGSFTKAATLHNMDNSSLSKQIKKLEVELGVQLLNRSTRSFSLTPAGEEILEQAHNLVGTLGHVHSIADSYQARPKGRIRITAPLHIGQHYLQPVITQFMRSYPEVEINLQMDDKRSDIISDHFDVAFRLGRLEDSSLIAKKIADIRPVILASESFIDQHGEPQTPEELMSLPSVVYSNGPLTVDTARISEAPGGSTFINHKMTGKYKVNDVLTLLAAVQDGLGYAMISSSNLYRPVAEMNLKPILTHYTLCNRGLALYALYPHRKQTALVREFISAVQAHIGTPPIWEKQVDNFAHLYPTR
ncbi:MULTISPECIES: LysR family transcriptional regulator [Vibrio]|jgi:DNA-binding transcriptional LysR family regulator|uniref:LysR family transcriptional regulator n=1 Tax=Vibrio TaxID=662 RepID=UPI0001B9398B|nr:MULTISPECIES: LysR family transcriptional regulator [Vibrio]EEX32892.1 transcriptional regulators LysR family [Vibrio coralliilyticus ATCC BAA-450]MCC2521601.1 LysR family transcriptional regulator [Vibrio coralliilyticus]MCM5507603.1 LysR family transcriptional regulator [Vibrio sp. SCSIO 43169]MDE3899511.1 LysR family transcriptional regulator [Vibrio sp. CC007]NOI27052.1 LysR family transcriptional regulator [Vibrio coralliilyticus]